MSQKKKKCAQSETQGLNYEHPLSFFGSFSVLKNCNYVRVYWDKIVCCNMSAYVSASLFMVILCASNTSYRTVGRDY